MNLERQNVLITGASRGLGRGLARSFARRGARVVLVARDADALAIVCAEIRAEGGTAFALPWDLTWPGAASSLAGAASAMAGPIDVLVNNAGVLGPVPLAPLVDTSEQDFASALLVNATVPFLLTRAVLGGMLVRGRGLVVNVSSDAAWEAYPGWGAYGAAKAALTQLTRVWSAEIAGTGVSMLAVDPGEMATRMHRDAAPEADPATLAQPGECAERLVAWLETATPEELAAPVVRALQTLEIAEVAS